jgi:hypothetical protein
VQAEGEEALLGEAERFRSDVADQRDPVIHVDSPPAACRVQPRGLKLSTCVRLGVCTADSCLWCSLSRTRRKCSEPRRLGRTTRPQEALAVTKCASLGLYVGKCFCSVCFSSRNRVAASTATWNHDAPRLWLICKVVFTKTASTLDIFLVFVLVA